MTERKLKVIIFGATGMVGKGVLLECVASKQVKEVISVSRGASGIRSDKLKEIIHTNFEDYSDIKENLENMDACFFCLGISSLGMKEDKYTRITYNFTIKAAEWMHAQNPEITMCYVSGTGTDSAEKGRAMWARVKGKTENKLFAMFHSAYMFRPGYIQPLKGVKSKVAWYQALYNIFGVFYPVLKFLFPGGVTNTVNVGMAMINAALFGYEKKILENRDINKLATVTRN